MKPPEVYGRLAWLEMLCRWFVGLAFIVASLHKIANPGAFAQVVYSYDLFPAVTINPVAIILPFVELVAGLALITAVYPRAAAGIISALLVAFAVIIAINLLRGHNFDCGCFPSFITRIYADTPVSMLIRDAVLLTGALPVLFYNNRRRGAFLNAARD